MAKISNVFSQTELKKETHPRRITKWIHYTKLKSNAAQYCDAKTKEEIEALADLIEASGEVLQDLLVRKNDADEYEIIAGHKRTAACKLLVEERGKNEYAFLPCVEKDISEVKAEFEVYSSNGHHVETAYETMYKLERMKYLLEKYPEEFPNMQTGRMVERLAKQYNMSRATVGEYQKISNGLGEKAMGLFENGDIDKSAAVALARMDEEEQENLLNQGIRTNKEIKEYQKKHFEFSYNDVLSTFGILGLDEMDTGDRKELAKMAAESLGKAYFACTEDGYQITCTPEHIELDGQKKMTWDKYMQLADKCIPAPAKKDEQTTVNLRRERKYIRVGREVMSRLSIADGTYVFVQNQDIRDNDSATLIEVDAAGRTTGNQEDVSVVHVESWKENPALRKGYSILYVEDELVCG